MSYLILTVETLVLIGVWFNTMLNWNTYRKTKKRVRDQSEPYEYETEYDLFFSGEGNMRNHETKFDY